MAPTNADSIRVGWFCTAFIDILGQSDGLKAFSSIPDDGCTDEEMEDFRQKCRNTYGRVLSLQDDISTLTNIFFNEDNEAPGVPEEHREYWRQVTDLGIEWQRISDGMILYIDLSQQNRRLTTIALSYLCAILALTELLSLAKGYTIRGGIDIGQGAVLPDGFLYGPSIYSAYHLESTIAQYPRIVLGDHAHHYIRQAESLNANDLEGIEKTSNPELFVQLSRAGASSCRHHFCIDSDGRPILDFLSPTTIASYSNEETTRDLVRRAYEFVVSESNRFKSERNTKLAMRYAMLREYFDSRVPQRD